MSEVTRILSAIEEGDAHAAEQLLPLVYDELRRLAAERMAQEKPGQTLQPTALVHEAYLRLVAPAGGAADGAADGAARGAASARRQWHWNSRGHFFAAAAEAMRRILIDNARRKRRHIHGGDRARLNLEAIDVAAPESSAELLALDDALGLLADTDPQAAELVKLRYFAGLTNKQAAQALGISPRSADFLWAYARAWLLKKIRGPDASSPQREEGRPR